VIAEAVRLGEASEGVFDITVAPELVKWGFLPKHVAGKEHPAGTYNDIILYADGRIGFEKPLLLDLGGIAKGFAVDKAAEFLTEAGVAEAVINAGGDLRFIGALPSHVALRDPRAPRERVIQTEVTAPAMATSAAYFANRRHHARKVSHILHPRTRKPMCSNVSVSVFAQSCMDADALTKVVLLDDPSAWQNLLVRERASCVFITAKGEAVSFPVAA
jgi:thiamine biosynthesis lipoprotein